MERLPKWIRRPLLTDQGFTKVHGLVKDKALHTVCESAACPNRHECWNSGTATVMLLGEVCTRSCRFCNVISGIPPELDLDEPRRVAEAVVGMELKHVVLTSVNRDDQPDGGAAIFAETIERIHEALPETTVEILTPDFEGDQDALQRVLDARPDVYSHNLETVRQFQPIVRPQASYGVSLSTLRYAAQSDPKPAIKSGLMLGFGESEDELKEAFADLLSVGCEILTLGQYLRPTKSHIPVARYVPPEEFEELGQLAREMGFIAVASGPFVRSSYKAEALLEEARATFPV